MSNFKTLITCIVLLFILMAIPDQKAQAKSSIYGKIVYGPICPGTDPDANIRSSVYYVYKDNKLIGVRRTNCDGTIIEVGNMDPFHINVVYQEIVPIDFNYPTAFEHQFEIGLEAGEFTFSALDVGYHISITNVSNPPIFLNWQCTVPANSADSYFSTTTSMGILPSGNYTIVVAPNDDSGITYRFNESW